MAKKSFDEICNRLEEIGHELSGSTCADVASAFLNGFINAIALDFIYDGATAKQVDTRLDNIMPTIRDAIHSSIGELREKFRSQGVDPTSGGTLH